MKRIIAALSLVMLSVAVHAQLAAMIHKAINVYYSGIVTFNDGRQVEYKQVELPKEGETEITVSNDAKRKKTTVLQSEKIQSITVWYEDYPSVRNTLYHISVESDGKNKTYKSYWGYPIYSSAWGTVYQCHITYTLDKKTGQLDGDYYESVGAYGMRSVNPASAVLLRKGKKKGMYIGYVPYNSSTLWWNMLKLKAVAENFADVPYIRQGILKKTVFGNDIQFVLDMMALSHGLHGGQEISDFDKTHATSSDRPVVTETLGINGTDGDDTF